MVILVFHRKPPQGSHLADSPIFVLDGHHMLVAHVLTTKPYCVNPPALKLRGLLRGGFSNHKMFTESSDWMLIRVAKFSLKRSLSMPILVSVDAPRRVSHNPREERRHDVDFLLVSLLEVHADCPNLGVHSLLVSAHETETFF